MTRLSQLMFANHYYSNAGSTFRFSLAKVMVHTKLQARFQTRKPGRRLPEVELENTAPREREDSSASQRLGKTDHG